MSIDQSRLDAGWFACSDNKEIAGQHWIAIPVRMPVKLNGTLYNKRVDGVFRIIGINTEDSDADLNDWIVVTPLSDASHSIEAGDILYYYPPIPVEHSISAAAKKEIIDAFQKGDNQVYTIPDNVERRPLGIMPKWLWKEIRARELMDAIIRYQEAGYPVPPEWIEELTVDLSAERDAYIERINRLQKPREYGHQ